MSIAAALILLAEATAACPPAAQARLGGGAEVARAVLDYEAEADESPTLTTAGASDGYDAAPADADTASEPDDEPTAGQCKAGPLPIA